MSQDEKPGWFGRLFGRKAGPAPDEAETPPTEMPAAEAAEVPAEAAPASEAPDEASSAPASPAPASPAPASPAEGQPDFATGADDVAHVPLPASEPAPADPDRNSVPDEIEGADLQPIAGKTERPPAGTAGDAPARGAEPADTTSRAFAPTPSAVGGTPASGFGQAEPGTASALAAPAAAPDPDIQPIDTAAALASDAAKDSALPEPGKRGWWGRLTEGMKRTSTSLSDRVTGLFTKRKLDATTLEDLEDALIQADFGLETATRISDAVGKGRYEKGISPDAVRAILATEVERALDPVAVPLRVDRDKRPFVILMVGVNGAGKTTTIGKLALKLRAEGRSVMLAAGDTFRAAAVEQLKVWGERTGTPVITRPQGSDAAGLAFDALQEAKRQGSDVLLIDTAGRLQNKAGLMAELEKIVRVLAKLDPEAPHATLLVLDATVGQNALSQVELFAQAAPVSGLVMTKLDGTARGGILVALAAKFGLPVHFIGVGEGVEDLEPFAARDFARAIAGLEKD
ncbi:signal recognition particle-docking protein FtsY [Methylobacterium soli]|uniref:Signal recognition particle receptor FtsY n=1 Tax=Methylobacterium soli TaxID=553447 RepID=A0A6L3SW13_9HYPH|nr:signal recognition particle-docking protein FtsY [Methylobacterium soli]KAB1077795.1 signal recognition particle-docking protein FtsY [Methylobacterium soli]GJE45472.1 Signal recognition particle receptor FtsY [Methylobacterium soli]